MRNHMAGTDTLPVTCARMTRDRRGLLDALAVIDTDGWDCATATCLLTYIRDELIRPLTIDVGLRGAAASQAEATAWEAVWLLLRDHQVRSARSPWGVVWQTARRALLGEILASRWGTGSRRAWERDAEERAGLCARPVSLDPLLEPGRESDLHTWQPTTPVESRVQFALECAAGALVGAGWNLETATRVVAEVAAMEDGLSHDATVVGWRPLATRLGLPPWQARRLTFVLRGSVDQPGLLARLITSGPDAAGASDVRSALAGTRIRRMSSPTRQQGSALRTGHPQVRAS